MEQIRSRGQQSSPGQVKCFLPPGVGAQPRHDPTVILQRESDDVPIKGEGLLGPGPPAEEGDALVPAQIHHARPGRGKANPPVHAARLAAGAPPRARAARMGRGSAACGGRGGGCRGGGAGRAPAAPGARERRHPRAQGGRRVPSLCVGAWRRPRDVIAPRGRGTGGIKSPTPRPAPAPHGRGSAASAPAARPAKAPRARRGCRGGSRRGSARRKLQAEPASRARSPRPPRLRSSPAREPERGQRRGLTCGRAARKRLRHPVGPGASTRSGPGTGWSGRRRAVHLQSGHSRYATQFPRSGPCAHGRVWGVTDKKRVPLRLSVA